MDESGDEGLMKLAAQPSHKGSGAALWMLLLLRLTSVATDQRVELRNSKSAVLAPHWGIADPLFRRYPNPDAHYICIW